MKKEIWLLCLPLLLLGGCGTQEKAQDPPQIITRKTVQEAKKAETPPEARKHRRRQKHRSRLRRKKNSRRLNRLLLKGKIEVSCL